jgi:hypothetical protein
MELSGQLHAPATSSKEEKPSVLIGYGQIRTRRGLEKIIFCRSIFLNGRSCIPLAMPGNYILLLLLLLLLLLPSSINLLSNDLFL